MDALQPVTISDRKVVDASGGQVLLEWTLTGRPDEWWIAAFARSPAVRTGSSSFVWAAPTNPDVRSNGTIRWQVAEQDLGGAASFVKESVDWANSQLPVEKGRRESQREQEATDERARAEKLNELQRKLEES